MKGLLAMNTFGESTGTDVTPTTIPRSRSCLCAFLVDLYERLVQNVGNVQERIGHAREVGRAVIERVGHAQLLKASAKRQLGIKLETRDPHVDSGGPKRLQNGFDPHPLP